MAAHRGRVRRDLHGRERGDRSLLGHAVDKLPNRHRDECRAVHAVLPAEFLDFLKVVNRATERSDLFLHGVILAESARPGNHFVRVIPAHYADTPAEGEEELAEDVFAAHFGEKCTFLSFSACQKRKVRVYCARTSSDALQKSRRRMGCLSGSVAQLVEQRIENPRVGGSIPSRATIFIP